jgi:hypothetical protein
MQVFAHILGTNTVDEECTKRVKGLLGGMQQSMPDVFNLSVGTLGDLEKSKLAHAMQA